MTLHQLLNEGSEALAMAGDPDASVDARQLLLAAFHLDMVHFLMNRMVQLEESAETERSVTCYQEMIEKRSQRIPQQQILGCQEFMGLDFFVNEHVLIPRQDTETLVERVLADHPERELSVLDMCTGSGCIAVSLAVKGGYQQVVAADISAAALKVARCNAEKLVANWEQRMCFVQGDMFQALEAVEKTISFDVIVSNPPYIPTAVIATLAPEVRVHEPLQALDGAEDGLLYYRIIAEWAKVYGRPGAGLYLEIGYDQGAAVGELLAMHGYKEIRVFRDLPGNERVVRAYLP